jgi:hypothetical protein
LAPADQDAAQIEPGETTPASWRRDARPDEIRTKPASIYR